MKFYFIFLFLCISLFGQNKENGKKYFVYFKDKGISAEHKLQKNDILFLKAQSNLTQRAIKRRKKVLGDEYISIEDVDVYQPYADSLTKLGIEIIWKLRWFNAVSCYLDDSQKEKLEKQKFIKSIEPVKSFYSQNNLHYEEKNPYVLRKINSKYGESYTEMNLSNIPIAHNLGITGDGVLIGVLDAGFSWKNHPALKNSKVVATYDFVHKDIDVTNDNDVAHGTHVLSLIAGNHYGRLIAPAYNSKFILAKTEDVFSERNVEEDNYVAALEWMESKGVDITTASLGYSEFDAGQFSYNYSDMDGKTAVCTKALEIAFQKGIITINSAGNEGASSWHYITAPADGFNVITVGAVDVLNRIASISSRGPTFDGRIKPEVVAMGVNNFVAQASTSDYIFASGTSLSTPLVAGMTAQLLSVFPYLTNKQVRQILIESGDNASSPNNDIGFGLLSIKRALTFPNLSADGKWLNKIFIHDSIAFDGAVKIYFKSSNEDEFKSSDLVYGNNLIYNYQFPSYTSGDTVLFFFEYFYNGTKIREPVVGNYQFVNGDNIIHFNLKIENPELIPNDFSLSQNYPNPFNPNTQIEFTIPATKNKKIAVTLKVYDILGREVAVLLNENKQAGKYVATFNASNLASGVYFYRLRAGDFSETKKMVLLK